TIDFPSDIAVDGTGNVYVTGVVNNQAFKIVPGGPITEIITAFGDGIGNFLTAPYGVAVDDVTGNVFVAGILSHNAFKITTVGTITKIIDSPGDGTHALSQPQGIAVDAGGNVYVVGSNSDNAFKIAAGGTIT